MIKITFKGADETRRFLADAPEALQKAVAKSLKQAAVLTKEEAVYIVPVDTGALRRSIYYRVSNFSYTVGAGTDYAGYVEYGTRKMRAQPYLRPAFIFVARYIPSAMGREIENEFGRL